MIAKEKMISPSVTVLLLGLWISFATAQRQNGNVLNNVRFYRELNFTGRLHYDQRYNLETCFNLDFDFYDMTTEPRVSSLTTSECLMVYDMEDCVGNPLRELNYIRIPPGEYPNLVEFLQKNYFPCNVMSFRDCRGEDAGLTIPYAVLKIHLHESYSNTDYVTEICGCQNIPVHASGHVDSLKTGHCITLFSESDCQGKSVNIPGGSTVASRDLRVVNFKNIAKSLDLCDSSKPPACNGLNIIHNYYNGYNNAYNYHSPPTLNETHVEEVEILKPFNFTEKMTWCKNTENVSCSTTCGGTMYTDRGVILYKLTESLESFERCVWIVRAPSHRSKLEVDLTWTGFKPIVGTQEILVSSYGPDRWHFGFGNKLRTQSLDMSSDPMQLVGALLVITLYTDDLAIANRENIKGGFILEYNSVEDSPEFPMSSFYSDHRIKIGQNLQYPLESEAPGNLREGEGATYSENELSTFLFLPNDGKENLKTGSKNYFVEVSWLDSLPDDSQQSKGEDYVASYYFRNDKWDMSSKESIGDKPKTFVNDDMILLFLHSKTNGTKGEQFYFKSGAQEKNICPWNLQRLQQKKQNIK